jgi:hypothetical protein
MLHQLLPSLNDIAYQPQGRNNSVASARTPVRVPQAFVTTAHRRLTHCRLLSCTKAKSPLSENVLIISSNVSHLTIAQSIKEMPDFCAQ